MDLGISGNTAVVTAGGNGLGKATAEVFVAEGVNVVINDISQEALDAAVPELEAAAADGAAVRAVQGDLTDNDDIVALIETTVDTFGGLDHLVLSAGGPRSGPFMEMEDADWQFAFDLLVMSVVRICRAAQPHLAAGDGGTIVASTSRSVKEAIPNLVLSNAVRSGVAGLAKTLAGEFAPEIRTNVVMPGPTETQRAIDLIEAAIDRGEYDSYEDAIAQKSAAIPQGRLGRPAEFGRFAVMLSSPVASYVNGTAIAIDGGAMKSNV